MCYLGVIAAIAAVCLLRLFWLGGSAEIGSNIFEIRAARLCTAGIVGGCLGLAGVFLQCLMRNPLASPDLLGLASGSGLAVLLTVYAGGLSAGAVMMGGGGGSGGGAGLVVSIAAMAGAMGALALTYVLSQRRGMIQPVMLILVGVAIGIVASAGSMLVRHLLPAQEAMVADRMLLGALKDDVAWRDIGVYGMLMVAGCMIAVWVGKAMDVASLSDDEARSIGVNLARLRVVMFVASGALTAVSILLAGPIGFVGLVCPHVARLMVGARHAKLAPLAGLLGALLMLAADAVVRVTELPSGRLPISVITAMVGGPVFVWMLRREGRGR